MLRDAKFRVTASTVVVVVVAVASLLSDVGVAFATNSDARCENGQILGHGVVLEVGERQFVLECDDGFEASPGDAVKCRDGVIVVEESAKCVAVDPTTSTSVTIRKIRSADQLKSGKRHHHEAATKRNRKQKEAAADADAVGRRMNRRKMMNRRRKIGFQADEGASAVPGEAVQWRSYGNDVVGED